MLQSRPGFDCPQWCEGGHDDTDPTEDRFHRSCDYRVSLTKPTPLAAELFGHEGFAALWITLYLIQPVGENKPRLWIGVGDTPHGFHIATYEAHHLARLILLLLTQTKG